MQLEQIATAQDPIRVRKVSYLRLSFSKQRVDTSAYTIWNCWILLLSNWKGFSSKLLKEIRSVIRLEKCYLLCYALCSEKAKLTALFIYVFYFLISGIILITHVRLRINCVNLELLSQYIQTPTNRLNMEMAIMSVILDKESERGVILLKLVILEKNNNICLLYRSTQTKD